MFEQHEDALLWDALPDPLPGALPKSAFPNGRRLQ